MKAGIAVGVVIAIVALVVGLAPLKEVAYTVAFDYQETETYYENEPYETTETYYEDEPYQDTETYYEEVPLAYEDEAYIEEDTISERRRIIIGDIVIQDEIVEVPIQVASVDVKNTDTTDGIFTVVFNVTDPMFGQPSLTRELSLVPNQTKTATCPSEELGDWSYIITPSTKTVEKQRAVTEYRQVEKQRTVTEYRQVEKERTVWKERLETRYKKVTLLDYFLLY